MASKVFLLTFISINLCSISLVQADKDFSFSIDLIHRDSPASPFYNPLDSQYIRMNKAFHRSISRLNHVKLSSKSKIQAQVIPDAGEYLMNISIGTPPVAFLGIFDTGSDLTWTQCEPCEVCHNQTTPIFNPKSSSTYRDLPCRSKPCISSDECSCVRGKCVYSVNYADNSYSVGDLATETLTMESVSLPKIVFGCGHRNQGSFNEHGTGIVGFGNAPYSLISQLNTKIKGKFSYCFIPFDFKMSTSKMKLGREGIVSGKGVVSTPLVEKASETFHYLTLEGISVGGKKVVLAYHLNSSSTNEEGNMIIDSGTTLTFLPSEFYNHLESAMRNAIKLKGFNSSQGAFEFPLCYKVGKVDELKAPLVTFHFKGADVVLQALNTFVPVDEGVYCLGMLPDTGGIFGNFAQINFLVGYDLKARTVSFKPTDCTTW